MADTMRTRVARLQGLIEGKQIAGEVGFILGQMANTLADMAAELDQLSEKQEKLSEFVDEVDQDLTEVETIVFGDEEGLIQEEVDTKLTFDCPHCHEKVTTEYVLFNSPKPFTCPHCKQEIGPQEIQE